MQSRLRSSFWDQWSIKCMHRWWFGPWDAPDFVMVATLIPSFPCTSLWSSLDIAGIQSFFRSGLFMSSVYFVMVFLVTGWMTPLHTSLMSILWRTQLGDLERACGNLWAQGALSIAIVSYAPRGALLRSNLVGHGCSNDTYSYVNPTHFLDLDCFPL